MKLRKEAIRFVIGGALALTIVTSLHLLNPDSNPQPKLEPAAPRTVGPASAKYPKSPAKNFSTARGTRSTNPTITLPAPSPVVQEGLVEFLPPLKQRAFAAGNSGTKSFRVTLLGGQSVDVKITRHEVLDEASGVIHGAAADEEGSHVLLAYTDDAVAGTMFFPSRGLYQIRYAGEGRHRVVQLDPNWSPACAVGEAPRDPNTGEAGTPIAVPVLHGEAATGAKAKVAAPLLQQPVVPTTAAPPAGGDVASTTVEILIAYTTTTKNANGGDSGISALINAAVATANTAFANSGAGVTLRLAGKVEVSYTDSGNLNTDLPRLANASDGYMDNVPVLRNNYKADLCSLLVHSGGAYAGLGYLWTVGATSTSFAPYGYSVVVDAYADSYYTLAHEVGHNFGCGHAPGDGGSGAYSYSTGYRFTVSGTQYRTVMAYAPGTRIPYFSNPAVKYLGVNTGSSSANNAQTILNSRATIAAIQTGSTLYLEWSPLAAGNLGGDTQADLIWRSSSSGRVISWIMSGTNTASTAALWSGDASWTPVATGDFNSDDQTDIVWRHSGTGRVIVWFMNGVTSTSTAAVWSGDPTWVPITTADFNADGKPDIVWRNSSTGRVIVWLMNGTTATSTVTLWAGDRAWVPVTTGDFNGDGKPDLVWRNASTGRVIVWLMNGTTSTGTQTLWTGDAAWVPVATADFNGDGKPDLLWRNSSSGRVVIWYLDGVTTTSTAAIWG